MEGPTQKEIDLLKKLERIWNVIKKLPSILWDAIRIKDPLINKIFWIVMGLIVIVFLIIDFPIFIRMKDHYFGEKTEKSSDTEIIRKSDPDCNVLLVDVAGYITSDGINGGEDLFSSGGDTVYSDDIKYQLDYAKTDEETKAVLLYINSYGGNAGSAQEVVYALENLDKPAIAVIRTAGNSAAYWIASVADKIYAYETADVGSIGVTMSYLDETKTNTKDGKEFVSLSIGKFKDMGNPDKSMTAEEKALAMRDIKDVYNIFVEQVAQGRNMTIEEVRVIADGSSMIAYRAKELGLIDEIGSTYDALDYLSDIIGEKANICQLED
jgi:signal peptide peptidase SppA